MSSKYQIEVQPSTRSRPIPRSGLYRSLPEAQAAAVDDIRRAELVLITRLSTGHMPEQWFFCKQSGEWQPGRPAHPASMAA